MPAVAISWESLINFVDEQAQTAAKLRATKDRGEALRGISDVLEALDKSVNSWRIAVYRDMAGLAGQAAEQRKAADAYITEAGAAVKALEKSSL